jgi:hypothetical protein
MHSVPARQPRTSASHFLLIATLFGTAACGGDGGSARAAEPGSGRAEHVRNGEAGRWKPGEAWQLVQQVRIGSADSGGPDMFGQIVDLAIDPLGRVWVADGHANQVRVFDGKGRHVRSIGQKGGGPGEFAQLAGMDFAPDGRLWVQDPGNARWSVFDTAGTLVATHRRPDGVNMSPWPGGFDRAGRLYDVALLPGENGELAQGIVRLGADLQALDTVPLPKFEEAYFEVVTSQGGSRSIQRVNVPFTGGQLWRVDPEGSLWTALTDHYRLYRHGPRGDTARIVEREQRPVPVSATEMTEMVDSYRWFVDMGGTLDRSRIPDTKPPFYAFFFSPDGTLWVIPSQGMNEPVRFDVFDPAGRYLGRVTGTERLLSAPAPAIRGDVFAAVVQDESGVPSVAVMRIERPRS